MRDEIKIIPGILSEVLFHSKNIHLNFVCDILSMIYNIGTWNQVGLQIYPRAKILASKIPTTYYYTFPHHTSNLFILYTSPSNGNDIYIYIYIQLLTFHTWNFMNEAWMNFCEQNKILNKCVVNIIFISYWSCMKFYPLNCSNFIH